MRRDFLFAALGGHFLLALLALDSRRARKTFFEAMLGETVCSLRSADTFFSLRSCSLLAPLVPSSRYAREERTYFLS